MKHGSEPALDDYQRKVISSIEATASATHEMLNVFLDFSKLEAGNITAEPVAFHLQPLLNKLETEFIAHVGEKNLIYRTRETSAAVMSDHMLLELILRNLIADAIRYTDDGGVLIGCRRRRNGMMAVEVWDTVIGVLRDQYQEIFREFYQIDNSERDRKKGLWVGGGDSKKTLHRDGGFDNSGFPPGGRQCYSFDTSRSEVRDG